MRTECYHVTNVTAPLPVALEHIAFKVQGLAPDHRDPERYHVEKSEIVAELQRLASEVRRYG